jgi:ribosomal protein S27E
MSQPIPVDVACRACGHEQPFTVWRSLSVTLDPEEKQELLDGRLTSSTCQQCGDTAQVVYDLPRLRLVHGRRGQAADCQESEM